MQVLLENIAFNHDADLSKTGSFFLRRNETQVVPIPEWRNECCSNPECAPAGYVIDRLPFTLTIKASFLCDDLQATSINVQALETTAAGTSILGVVEARTVPLQNGRSGLVEFNLPNARSRITGAGVSVSDVTWQWQFATGTQAWKDFQTTEHRIYSVSRMPNKPWNPTSNSLTDINVPWTEVLDHACAWAAGLIQENEIAESITRNVYQLGQQELMRWDGGPCYVRNDLFDCTAFLQLLKQRIGNGQAVNCDDCATIVSTFSNILGCNLFQSNMGFDFDTHPVLLIGNTEECAMRFGKHAVAWQLECDASAALFDACLQVDTDGKPGIRDIDHEFTQPTGLVFDNMQPDSYKFCFFNVGACEPKPRKKKQRSLGSGPFGQPRIDDEDYLDILKRFYTFDAWDNHTEPLKPFDFRTARNAFAGWDSRRERRFEDEALSSGEALLKRSDSAKELVEITVHETKPPANPKELLLQLLGSVEALHFTRLDPEIGEVSFVDPKAGSVLFKRRNFVVAVRSVGFRQTSVLTMAAAIDLKLQQQFSGLPYTLTDLLKPTDII